MSLETQNTIPPAPKVPNPNVQADQIAAKDESMDASTNQEEKEVQPDTLKIATDSREKSENLIGETVKSLPKTTNEVPVQNEEETEKPAQEELPSFEEWRQKELEAEKNKGPVAHISPSNTNSQPSDSNSFNSNAQNGSPNSNGVNSGKRKTNGVNYASARCGAKILNSNSDSSNVHAILTENKDSYMNSPCSAKRFFTVELCESIAVRAIQLGSYELFSSLPKTFSVKVSERWPTKEWRSLGIFHARETRDVQLFNVVHQPNSIEIFTKYLRIDMLEHYGKEHYCPVSVLRVYGITDDYDDSDTIESEQVSPQDDDNVNLQSNEKSPTLFKTAKDTVLGLMHKMLSKEEGTVDNLKSNNTQHTNETNENNSTSLNKTGTFSGPCTPNAT